jgi:hypothetical protein
MSTVYTAKCLQLPTSLGVMFGTCGTLWARTRSLVCSSFLKVYGIFLKCVSFSLCRVFLYVSRIPSGQVKTSGDCALQSGKSTLCWVHPRRRVKLVPALTQRLAPIPARSGSLATARRLRTRPVAVLRFAPALWVTGHRASPHTLASYLW